jgi:hypothetical protein
MTNNIYRSSLEERKNDSTVSEVIEHAVDGIAEFSLPMRH